MSRSESGVAAKTHLCVKVCGDRDMLYRASTRERALEAMATFLEDFYLPEDVFDRCAPPAIIYTVAALCAGARPATERPTLSTAPHHVLNGGGRRDTLLLLFLRSVRSGGVLEAALAARSLALLAITLGAGDASERCDLAPALPYL